MKLNLVAVILTFINAVLLVFILAKGSTTVGPIDSNVLRVQVLELVDDHGMVRAQLNVESDGEVVFRLRDASGTIRVKLGASEDGSGLLLLNNLTEPGIQLITGLNGTKLMLTGTNQASRVIEP